MRPRTEGFSPALASSLLGCMLACSLACTPPERCFDATCATGGSGAGGASGSGGSGGSGGMPSVGGGMEGPKCGDGTQNAEEACDELDLGGTTCEEQGSFGGMLSCLANCQLDTVPCLQTCGDLVISVDSKEACDGSDFGMATCQTFLPQSPGGALVCGEACAEVDASGCEPPPTCATGVVDPGEQCDGLDLAAQTCETQGFVSGELACHENCSFDTSACTHCGNGVVDLGELCDGPNLNGETCASRGFAPGGSPLCSADCTSFNTAGCDPCGNDVVNSGEACDGTALAGATCESLGFLSGTAACTSSCGFDTSGCSN